MARVPTNNKRRSLRQARGKLFDSASSGRSAQDDIREGFGEAFLVNDRVNQLLLENLDAKAWRAKPPGGKVRTIAAIFTHMHNIRRKWVRLSAPHLKLPPELDRARCTQKQAAAALKESAQLCAGLAVPGTRAFGAKNKSGSVADTPQFVRDGWAKPWGLEDASGVMKMLAYMVSHEAHHRGQVCMLAHQMGYRLPMKVMSEMWNWEGLAVQANALHHPITRTSCVIGTPVRAKSKARAQGARHRKS
jgi:uncharacterized damage-inducible protein DinB